ncbi:MAG: glycosyltransferase family 1 protein [Burkholderiaceae bacterium]|nr:MAG: glycosyltransferase family 1 protein [Burkholderiaceae bacterium]
MRIGIDASSLLCPEPRGEGKTLLRLYQEIARLRPDFEFVLFGDASAGKVVLPALPNARIVTFSCPGFRWNTWENVGLPWQAWRAGCDVLHATSSGAPRWTPLPVVMTVHDLIPLLFDDGQSLQERTRFAVRLRNGLRAARAVIAVSQHTQDDLLRLFSEHVPAIQVVPWGGDPVTGTVYPRPVLDPYVLAFGGGAPRKNTEFTIRSFAQAAADHVDIKLVILGVGRAVDQRRVMQIAAAQGIADRLVLPGFISEAQLPAYYQHALCLSYLSLYEGFGLPVLEAMSHGVPVLASARTSIPEVVGEAGVLVNPDRFTEVVTAFRELLEDVALRERLRKRGVLRSSEFSWERCAKSIIAILTAAVASPKKPRA